ncbi:MAG: hypothetical protein C4524_01080 [Candidatus Zixiibacteriota bacterium]|nr:MAG: hypothetical protein C4524_01080 [candidate division Zixibacteria bacterium]
MLARTVVKLFVTIIVLVVAGNAMGQEKLQNYFNDTAEKVKATENPVQKRDLLDKSLQGMSRAVDQVESSVLISKEDRAGLDRLKVGLQDKQDELMGRNGYERVPDSQLNAFANYVVQDMEQADRTITISLVAALLIIIIIILLV